MSTIPQSFTLAREAYSRVGVDVEEALRLLPTLPISIHCWQGDDVQGFETTASSLGGGLAVTGNYPGRARNPDELRQDLEKVFLLVPGRHRLNLHASYGEFIGKKFDRNAIEIKHFQSWIQWADQLGIGLDFNPTFFSHPLANDGLTLAHPKPSVRKFWIEHGQRCREIGAAMGKALRTPCINNVWIPDGYKDTPADRLGPRERLARSLDQIFQKPFPKTQLLDSVEGKLFGLGSESYVVGSHEFYLGYAISRQKLLCLDAGHFHPTESIADKLSSVLLYLPRVLLHLSRGVRWDSDHVVTLQDELLDIAREVVNSGAMGRIHLGLDFFDASLNRVAAWVIGTRNVLKALLIALLQPTALLQDRERAGDFTHRLALMEECKTLPWAAVWDYYCLKNDVPVGLDWLKEVKAYEDQVLSRR